MFNLSIAIQHVTCLQPLTPLFHFFPVFAYVGGLVVFLSTFFRITVHYIFRGIFLVIHWTKSRFSGRDGRRPSPDNPNVQDLHEDISEPFQYVEVENGNTAFIIEQHSYREDNKEDGIEQEEDNQGLVDAMVGSP